MSSLSFDPEKIEMRLAKNSAEIEAAQRLRYEVFYNEFGAQPDEAMKLAGRDMDDFDAIADHLVVVDHGLDKVAAQNNSPDNIVGTYRLLRQSVANEHDGFYTSDEYDIEPLINSGTTLLELGRSCVLPAYRARPVLQKMWQGIAHYVADHDIGMMFGCASLHGTDIDALSEQLSYLYHFHLADKNVCPRALSTRYVDMNIIPKDDLNVKKAFMSLPPLMKGYIRLGASIGDGAVVDEQFNTTDICIVMPTANVTDKYLKHYERVTDKKMPTTQGAA